MIDTDKYEGHTEGEWRVDDEMGLVIKYGERPHDFVDMENKANAQLMADAPLLLEEVKRLRSILGNIKGIEMDWGIDFNHASITVTHFTGLMLSGELKLEVIE